MQDICICVWGGKYSVVLIGFVLACVALFYFESQPQLYKSQGIYAAKESNFGPSAIGGQLGGLAAFAGIDLRGGGASEVGKALTLSTSWPFLDSVISQNDWAPLLFAVDRWSAKDGKIYWNENKYDTLQREWKLSKSGVPFEPTSFEAYKAFIKNLSIEQDSKSGMLTVTVWHRSPVVAKNMVEKLVQSINQHFQVRDVEKTKKNIAYLEEKIANTGVAQMKNVFYGMVENQMQKLMLAEVDADYILDVVVPPRVAERSSKNYSLLFLVGCAVGFGAILGAAIALTVKFILGVDARLDMALIDLLKKKCAKL